MSTLLFDQKDRVGAWVAQQVGQDTGWGDFYALGVEMGGEVVAGVVFNNYNAVNATAHIAIAKPCKAAREMIRHAFRYAFVECGLKRLTGMVPVSEPKTIAFDQHLGFEPEFIMESAAFDGGGLQVLVMWPDKCRWLRRN
jgi:RimJ/RimL family protein N-acetyltransferase